MEKCYHNSSHFGKHFHKSHQWIKHHYPHLNYVLSEKQLFFSPCAEIEYNPFLYTIRANFILKGSHNPKLSVSFSFFSGNPIMDCIFHLSPIQVFQTSMLSNSLFTLFHVYFLSTCNIGTELILRSLSLFFCQSLNCPYNKILFYQY